MQDFLLQKLTALSDEERAALDEIALGRMESELGEDFEIKDTRLTRGAKEVIVLPHTRYSPSPAHKHNYVEIMIVLRGHVTHVIDGKELCLDAGDILFLNSHIAHSIRSTERGDVAVNVIMSKSFISALYSELCDTVFSDFIRETARDDGAGIYLHFRTSGERQIENLTENILYELTEYQSSSAILTKTVALLFHYLSLKNRELLADSSITVNREDQRKLQILSYINNNYRTARLTELAEKLGISVPYLSKNISEYFGKSFKELLVDRRTERACELLRDTDIPVGQIIRSMGYENESYFHREFKRRIGLSPLAVRKAAAEERARKKESEGENTEHADHT